MNDCCYYKQGDEMRRKYLMRRLAFPYRFTTNGIEAAYPQHQKLLACTAKCATLVEKEQRNEQSIRLYDHGRPRSNAQIDKDGPSGPRPVQHKTTKLPATDY